MLLSALTGSYQQRGPSPRAGILLWGCSTFAATPACFVLLMLYSVFKEHVQKLCEDDSQPDLGK